MVAQGMSGVFVGSGVNVQVCTPDGILCKVRMQCSIGGGEGSSICILTQKQMMTEE